MRHLHRLASVKLTGTVAALLAAALPAFGGTITDANFAITASDPGTQASTNTPGTATFADSAAFAGYAGSLTTSVATIAGGALDPSGSTNPGTGVTGGGSITNWISASSAGPITITFNNPTNDIGFLWGSLDPSNTVSFYNGSTLVASYAGSQILAAGAQYYSSPASFVNFQAVGAGSDFNKVTFSDSSTFFEIDNLASPSAVPEPSTWALLIGGLSLMGAGGLFRVGRGREAMAHSQS